MSALNLENRSTVTSAQKVLYYAITALFLWRCYDAATGAFVTHWHHDFKHFWLAGHAWLNGRSPYLPEHLDYGAELFYAFTNPFFYPPAILPALSPLSALPMPAAARVLFLTNIILILFICGGLSKITACYAPRLDRRVIFFLLLFLLAIYIRPVMRVIIYGQVTIILCAAFMCFLHSVINKRSFLAAGALTLLLMKPQIGLGLLAYALCRKDLRIAGALAVFATGALSAAGLAVEKPVEAFFGYFNGVGMYASMPENNSAASGGFGYLFGLWGIQPSSAAILAAVIAVPAVIARAQQTGSDLVAISLVMVWSIFAAPNHSTDFVLLAPILIFLFTQVGAALRIVLAAIMAYIGRSWEITAFISHMTGTDPAHTAAMGHTIALAGLLAFLALMLRRNTTYSPEPTAASPQQTLRHA